MSLAAGQLLLGAEDRTSPVSDPGDSIAPVTVDQPEPERVQWAPLLRQSLFFLGIQHSFRLATEPGTREGFRGSYFKGYLQSVRNLHGWADGDPFLVNFIGHPLQGAVAGHLWMQNDPRYQKFEFGKDPRYWKGRARAFAYSFAYSTQFEIGLLSEASIGQVQSQYPQTGFVDHVITPVMGSAWMIGEDWIDKAIVRRLENKIENRVARMLLRGGLNPARSMANMMAVRPPWHRNNRAGVESYFGGSSLSERVIDPWEENPNAAIRRMSFDLPGRITYFGDQFCVGAGGSAAYRFAPDWELVGEVSGCNMFRVGEHASGDSLTYMIGPRWTPRAEKRWSPRTHLLIGGHSITREQVDPERRAAVLEGVDKPDFRLLRPLYTETEHSNSLAVAVGVGLDVGINRLLAVRVADLQYMHTWMGPREWEQQYRNGVRFSTGIVLRMGAW